MPTSKNRSPRKPGRPGRVILDGKSVTLEQIEAVADGASCKLAGRVRREVRRSRKTVEQAVASGRQIYGVNTGFGQLARVRIPDDQLDRLQQNLIRSHSAGVGDPLPERVVRAPAHSGRQRAYGPRYAHPEHSGDGAGRLEGST